MEDGTEDLWITVASFKASLDSCNEEVQATYKNLPDSAIEADCMLLDFVGRVAEDLFPDYPREKQRNIGLQTLETILKSMTVEQIRNFLTQLSLQHEKAGTWSATFNTPFSRILLALVMKNVEAEMQKDGSV